MRCIQDEVRGLLEEAGIVFGEEQIERLERHVELVREMNKVLSLVSEGDLAALWERHVVDSLSLAGWVRACGAEEECWLDIGSGGGFPAIPIRVVAPDARLVMVERSVRKAGFLMRVVKALGLEGAEVEAVDFRRVACAGVRVVTARAVEKPEQVLESALGLVREGAALLWQGGVLGSEVTEMFHVEHVRDGWTERGLRRGDLAVIRPRS